LINSLEGCLLPQEKTGEQALLLLTDNFVSRNQELADPFQNFLKAGQLFHMLLVHPIGMNNTG